jgi:glycosyltransferase involved in cell wall biosynthesis
MDLSQLTGKDELLAVCSSYNTFQKGIIDSIAPFFSEVHALVRTNPFAEISKYFPLPSLDRYTVSNKIDLTNKPDNTHVTKTPIWYLPWDQGYRTLGDKQFVLVDNYIQKYPGKFSLVHSQFVWSAGYVGAQVKKRYNIPFIVTAHGGDIYIRPFKNDFWRHSVENVLNTADHIITVSQSNLTCIQKLDVSTPVTVIPNGFKSDLFYPRNPIECKTVLNLPQDKVVILTVGNLEPIKGHVYLIDAIQKITQVRKDILCVIVGSGKLHKKLEHKIYSLGLEDHIMLAGRIPHNEIPLWMNACDLFVLSSLNEGNPTVLVEALGCGKPFVGTRVGGVPEVICSEKYGLLVEPADVDDLTEKILLALNQEWDQEVILEYAEQYTWENIAKETMRVYIRVLNTK